MPLLSLIGTGAGLLANGVKRLFSGEAKAARQEKRDLKKEAKEIKKAAYQSSWEQYKGQLATAKGGGGSPAAGSSDSVTALSTDEDVQAARRSAEDTKPSAAMAFLKKNWMYIAGGLVLANFLGLIGKKKSVGRRRRSPVRTRTVTRYRTRRPAKRKTSRRRR